MDEINCHEIEIEIKHIKDNNMRTNHHTFYKIKTIFLPFSVSLSKLLLDPKRANFNKILNVQVQVQNQSFRQILVENAQ